HRLERAGHEPGDDGPPGRRRRGAPPPGAVPRRLTRHPRTGPPDQVAGRPGEGRPRAPGHVRGGGGGGYPPGRPPAAGRRRGGGGGGDPPDRRTASSSRRRSAVATTRRAAGTASGLTEIESIPSRTRCSAKDGSLDGAWPQSDEVMPASWQAVMMRAMASSTASSDSSNSSAHTVESRSTPSISWVRSFDPIDTPSTPMAAYSGMR